MSLLRHTAQNKGLCRSSEYYIPYTRELLNIFVVLFGVVHEFQKLLICLINYGHNIGQNQPKTYFIWTFAMWKIAAEN